MAKNMRGLIMTLKEIDAKKNGLIEILQKTDNEVTRLEKLKRLAREVGASWSRFEGKLSEQYQSENKITEGEIVHNIQDALKTETMIEMCRISDRNLWIAVGASIFAFISALIGSTISFLSMVAAWVAVLAK